MHKKMYLHYPQGGGILMEFVSFYDPLKEYETFTYGLVFECFTTMPRPLAHDKNERN
jgi:hypothetical protein